MSHEKHSGERAMLTNLHLKKWNENIALDIQGQYALEGKHHQERSQQSLVDGIPAESAVVLKTRQLEELHELKHQQDKKRIALSEQHVQEVADFD